MAYGNDKMKVSFVEPHLEVYGGIRRIMELANRLAERGHNVTIFHSDGSPCKWMKCITKVKSYDEVLSETHDVIIYNDPNPIDYRLVKKAEAKLKVFYVLALYERDLLKGINPEIFLPWNKRMLILRKSLRSPYLRLSNSTWIYYWLKENMNIDSKLLIGGVNTEMFYPVEVRKNPNETRILCSGDPRERKGTKTILEAVEIVKKENPRIVLDAYYGKGVPQRKMAEKYSSADIFVDGQWYAGWNNPVAEAMACRLPIICTNISGVRDFAFHEKTALLVPPKDSQAMALAITRLIRDKKLRETLRESAYQHIRQFDWNKSTKRFEEILTSELNRKKAVSSKVHTSTQKLFRATKSISMKMTKMNNFDPLYTGSRNDILSLIPDKVKKVLDVGCSVGALGESIKQRNGAEVVGIEMDKQMGEIASEKIDRVIVRDIEKVDLKAYFPLEYFDCIIFADILEHLRNPWGVLKNATNFLDKKGVIIASIPNVRHYTTVINLLLRGYWPYRERGIHDKNHVRFFTLRNIKELFQNADLSIIKLERNYRIIERPHRFNRFSRYFALSFLKDFLTFQYRIVAKKSKQSGIIFTVKTEEADFSRNEIGTKSKE